MKKRILGLVLVLCMLTAFVPCVRADGVDVSDVYVACFSYRAGEIRTKISSLDEFETLMGGRDPYEILAKYDEAFFEDKFLYLYYIDHGSSGNKYSVTSVTENADTIAVEVTEERSGYSDDIMKWFTIVEADKSLYDKDLSVTFTDVARYVVEYFDGNITPDEKTEDVLKPYTVKIDAYEDLPEQYQNTDYKYLNFNNYFLLVINWIEPQPVRTLGLANVTEGDNNVDIEMFRFAPNGDYPDVVSEYCAVLRMPRDAYDKDFNVSIKGEAPRTSYPYEITGLRLTNAAGTAIDYPEKNKSFIVEADIKKTEERNEKDYLFVAVYGTDGTLISLDYVKAKFTVDGECSFGFSIPPHEKAVGIVKAFVWNTFNSMEPLAENKTLLLMDEIAV